MTEQLVGKDAEKPTEIPPRGWWQVVRRAFKESSADNVPILAAGVAFFAFLAIFPAMIAAITLYGLVADPETVAAQVRDLSAALPEQAQPILADQLQSVASASGGALGIGLVVSLLAAVWSASSGTGNLIKAINIAYDEDETRGFLKVRGIALALTLGAIVFVLLTLALVAVVPVVLNVAAPRAGGHGPRPGAAVGAARGPRRGRARRHLPDRARPRRNRASPGSPPARWSPPCCGSSAASRSASTSTTSAATTRPTARSRAWSC